MNGIWNSTPQPLKAIDFRRWNGRPYDIRLERFDSLSDSGAAASDLIKEPMPPHKHGAVHDRDRNALGGAGMGSHARKRWSQPTSFRRMHSWRQRWPQPIGSLTWAPDRKDLSWQRRVCSATAAARRSPDWSLSPPPACGFVNCDRSGYYWRSCRSGFPYLSVSIPEARN